MAGSEPAVGIPALTCKELVELVTDYLEGTLPPTEHARFEAHIAVCPNCARYLEQMRATINAAGELHEEAIEPDARAELLALFRDWAPRASVAASQPHRTGLAARVARWFGRKS